MAKQVVYPGDPIGIAEEFVPGPGTYEENGEVYAATMGNLVLDTTDFEARVEPFPKQPASLKIGDVIIGVVHATRPAMAIVEVKYRADQPDRPVAGDTNGTLHVSKASTQYVDSMEDAFRARAILRAEVLAVSPAIQLTTKDAHYGILKCYCPRCGTAMDAKGNGLVCPECDWKDACKIADDYGKGHIL